EDRDQRDQIALAGNVHRFPPRAELVATTSIAYPGGLARQTLARQRHVTTGRPTAAYPWRGADAAAPLAEGGAARAAAVDRPPFSGCYAPVMSTGAIYIAGE